MGLSHEEANHIMAYNGWFQGLDIIYKNGGLSKQDGARVKAGAFGLMLAKLLEAKKELGHLQRSAYRLESLLRSGTVPKPHEGLTAYTPDVGRTQAEMDIFDGWVISLLESDISLLMAVRNQESAAMRVNGLGKSFARLFSMRVNDGYKMMKGFPGVFNMDIQF